MRVEQGVALLVNRDDLELLWPKYRGKVREHWVELSERDLDEIAGSEQRLSARLQQRYGMGRHEAEEELRYFLRRLR